MDKCVYLEQHLAEHHVDAGRIIGSAVETNRVHDCPVCGKETYFFPTCPLRACIVQHHVDAGTIAEGRDAMDAAENREQPEDPPQAVTLRDDPPTATTTTTWECNTCALPCVLHIKHATWTGIGPPKPKCCPIELRHSTWKLSPPENPPVADAEENASFQRGIAAEIENAEVCLAEIRDKLSHAPENPPTADAKSVEDCHGCERAQRCSECGLLNGGASHAICAAMGGYKPTARETDGMPEPLPLWKAADDFCREVLPGWGSTSAKVRDRLLAVLAAYTEVGHAS